MDVGRIFLVLGVIFLVVGAGLSFLPKDTPPFSWFGHLPGDVYYRTETTVVYIPWVSMLLASVVVSGVLQLIKVILDRIPTR